MTGLSLKLLLKLGKVQVEARKILAAVLPFITIHPNDMTSLSTIDALMYSKCEYFFL